MLVPPGVMIIIHLFCFVNTHPFILHADFSALNKQVRVIIAEAKNFFRFQFCFDLELNDVFTFLHSVCLDL